MLSLCELRRAAGIIEAALTGAALRRVVQPGGQELALVFEKAAAKFHVLLSCRPDFARICFAEPMEPSDSAGSFYEYLRAHLPGAFLVSIDRSGGNRQISLQLSKGSDAFALILSILGARSNIYLLDGQKRILHSMRPLDETRRELRIGEAWADPEGSVLSEGIDRWENLPNSEYLLAIGAHYRQLELKSRTELLARKIEQALKRERLFLDRKAINLREDLGKARQAETYRRAGELLKNVLHTIRPGDESASATDYGTGETVLIPLDPKLSPAANLEFYFARYQKDSRGVKVLEQQLDELDLLQTDLETWANRLRETVRGESYDAESLEKLAAEPKVRRLMQRLPRKKKAGVAQSPTISKAQKGEVPARLLPKRYRTEDRLEIWVGRSDEGNDYLTTRLARGNDLFFHLEGYPGSHVVLRTEGRPDPPPKSVLDACELAVHFSKMKNAGSADVHMAHIKDVKKPKGAKAGLVYVRSGKTIRLRRDPKRLQNILASRLDQ
jgi:predicted ribosome quality control (RQC) complex YloA/Tae2 family protein